ncbi:LuxR C-terminal-related transcriptional regulator [Leucobacter chironomi]|uniref:LuxR C-terminal-related transcriptional regulator n=1 Tax=Leucobacter chironomi TaxID=491918 RepID=UPI00040137B1|nr:LuxR C-terminal-related transcriptional regulator [Leucobacter chironomi]
MVGDPKSKTAVPLDAPGHLRRDRLLAKIEGGGRVVVVRAEGGAGKTALIARWMRDQQNAAIAWVTLDEGIIDPRSFWLRTFAALRATAPDTFQHLADGYMSGFISPENAPSLLASTLLRAESRVALVLDDLHLADDSLQDQLVSLTRVAPPLRIIATTRQRTRFESPLTSTAIETTVIGSEELAFTREEIAELAAALPYPITDTELTVLERTTRGHSLAVRLALSVMDGLSTGRSRRPALDEIERGVTAVLVDFTPRFEEADEEALALAVALCPEVDEALATRLSGTGRGWSTVESFEERGLGRIALRRGRPVFLMHALVSSALRHRAQQELSAERVAEVRRIAFDQLRDLADPVETLALLVDGGMDHLVFPHFARHFSELSQFRPAEVIALLSPLSPERLKREGGVPITLSIALSESAIVPTQRIKQLLRIGLTELSRRSTVAGSAEAKFVALARFGGMRVSRNYDEAFRAGERFAHIIEHAGSPSGASWLYAGNLQIVITALLAHRISRALELAGGMEGDPHPGRPFHTRSVLSFVRAYTGDLVGAEREIAMIGTSPWSGWEGSLYALDWHLASALSAANRDDRVGAMHALQPIAKRIDEFEQWPLVAWTRGVVRLVGGEAARGLEELEATRNALSSYPLSSGWAEELRTLHADLLLATGDLLRARTLLAHKSEAPVTRLARARLALLSSQPEEASALLGELDPSRLYPAHQAQHLLLSAAAHARLGNTGYAAALLEQALYALDRTSNRLPLSWVPATDLRLLRSLVPASMWIEPVSAPFETETEAFEKLSRRESLVLAELAGDASIEEVAGALHVSVNTIKSQTRSIYRKLQVSCRADALLRARQIGLL